MPRLDAPEPSADAPGPEVRVRRTRLHRWNRDHGASMREFRGVKVPWRYQDEPEGLGADVPGANLLDLGDHDRLELTGPDRRRFLGGLITCDAAHLEAGSGSYGFVTSIKGKVLADVVVAEFEDRTFLLLPPGRAELVRGHLRKYIVADRVEVFALEDLIPLALVGEAVPERLAEFGAWPTNPWGTRIATIAGTQLPVSRHERLGLPALVLWLSSSIVELVATELLQELGLGLLGRERLDGLRVEQGLPWFGIDYDEEALPQETGIDAVDFTKGCYLGQEVIARLHYRGQAPRLMRRLRWDGEERSPVLPAPVYADGRPAGDLTTSAGSAGLARLQRRVESGESVVVGAATVEDGGIAASVEALSSD